jgi:hypothetical protein
MFFPPLFSFGGRGSEGEEEGVRTYRLFVSCGDDFEQCDGGFADVEVEVEDGDVGCWCLERAEGKTFFEPQEQTGLGRVSVPRMVWRGVMIGVACPVRSQLCTRPLPSSSRQAQIL